MKIQSSKTTKDIVLRIEIIFWLALSNCFAIKINPKPWNFPTIIPQRSDNMVDTEGYSSDKLNKIAMLLVNKVNEIISINIIESIAKIIASNEPLSELNNLLSIFCKAPVNFYSTV